MPRPPKLDPALVALALRMARSFMRKLPRNVLREDIEQAALLGVVDALRLHPEGGTGPGWEWYVSRRVRGSIIDDLRAQDWASRRTRKAIAAGHVPTRIVRFDDLLDGHGHPLDVASDAPSPEEQAELRLSAAKAWETPLPPRERALMVARYERQRAQHEVGASIGVSEARVCQLERRALAKMRSHMGAPPWQAPPTQ
jgi:RNA polymerase sigma factor for flagellar operon FliA